MEMVESAEVIDLEQFRCLADFALDRSANAGNIKAANDLLALIDRQKARGHDQPNLCDLCRVREEVVSDDDGISFCQECLDGWRDSWQPINDEDEK